MFDWIFNWFDQLAQSIVWKSFLGHFQWIDWLALFFVIGGVIYGIRKGLMGEVAEIVELTIVICLVHGNYEKLIFFLDKNFGQLPSESLPVISFIVTATLVWFVVAYIASRLKSLVHTETSTFLRMLGGALFGAVHFILLLSFLLQALYLMPLRATKKIFELGGSLSGYYLARVTPSLYHFIFGKA